MLLKRNRSISPAALALAFARRAFHVNGRYAADYGRIELAAGLAGRIQT